MNLHRQVSKAPLRLSAIFLQFLWKFGRIKVWCPLPFGIGSPWEILDPSLLGTYTLKEEQKIKTLRALTSREVPGCYGEKARGEGGGEDFTLLHRKKIFFRKHKLLTLVNSNNAWLSMAPFNVLARSMWMSSNSWKKNNDNKMIRQIQADPPHMEDHCYFTFAL